jgi:hypothetical protein
MQTTRDHNRSNTTAPVVVPRRRHGVTRLAVSRLLAFLVLLPVVLVGLTVAGGQGQAHAITPDITMFRTVIPTTTAALATIGAGEGTVALTGATAATAATVVGGLAALSVVGFGIGYAAGLAGTAGFKMLWNWASSHQAAYADPDTRAPSGCSSTGKAYTIPGATLSVRCGGANGIQDTYIGATPRWNIGWWRINNSTGVKTGVSQKVAETGLTSGFGCTATVATNDHCQYGNGAGTQVYFELWPPATGAGTGGNPNPSSLPPGGAGSTAVTTTPQRTCTPTDGTAATTVAGQPSTYTGATALGALPTLDVPACPAGSVGTGISFPTVGPGGATVSPPLAPWTAPTLPSGFPECAPAGRCQLVLTRVAVDGSTMVCNMSPACTGWATQPLMEPLRTVWDVSTGTQVQTMVPTDTEGATYRCQWGPYELKASECGVVPTESPGSDVGTATGDSSCFKSGWSWNPVSWVVTPIKCLFMPKSWTSVSTLKTTFTARPPGSVIVGGASMVDGFVAGMSTTCGPIPDFTPTNQLPAGTVQLPNLCQGESIGSSQADSMFSLVYTFTTFAIYCTLAWSLWGMAEAKFGDVGANT